MRKTLIGLTAIPTMLFANTNQMNLFSEDDLLIDVNDYVESGNDDLKRAFKNVASRSAASTENSARKEIKKRFDEYRVQKGDTLFKIAQRLIGRRIKDPVGLESMNFLISHNPQIKNPNKIEIGQIIQIPDKESKRAFLLERNDQRDFYVVKKGDTLSLLAQSWIGLPFYKGNKRGSLDLVVGANPQFENPDKIEVGDLVFVPEGAKKYVSQVETENEGELKFSFPKKYVVTGNSLVSIHTDKLNVDFSVPVPEGHLVFSFPK